MKNQPSPPTIIGPSATMRAVSTAAATSVSRLNSALISGACLRQPQSARKMPPASGMPSTQ
jgi:hypothetical protein